ncbi:orotate phosphoribosyltransferase [Candidatus Acidianus copahuensis]|uniref:Orotate phosphoribosyltransferase n=1 Tax=Candidatus Acidianus copahuensis TaxID=1160895 RepID=A0A031LMX1_9CREN|nr:orotate phosphoribosyltransferase [Candidatus Acidianus copahuensis]EZQ04831.1 orotate phosphoribosyltransferase [Candidatus Acidianus copahuensis]
MNFAEELLDKKLLLIGSFVLTSGRTSPYYLDLRRLPNYQVFFDVVSKAIDLIKGVKFDMILGVATGGVPLASFLSCKLTTPMGYVRLEKKGHGTDKLLEADVKGKKVIIVDDVATSGGSIEKSALIIRENGGEVNDALVIVDREEGAKERLQDLGINLYSVFSIHEILNEISSKLSDQERKLLQDYLVKKVE